jgi:hypothetical protein
MVHCMLWPIATAPKTGEPVSLYALGSPLEVGRWSREAENWVGPKGEPLPIVPTHWVALPDDENVRTPQRTRTVLIVSAAVICIGLALIAITSGFFSVLQTPQNKAQLDSALSRDPTRDHGTNANRTPEPLADASAEQAKQATPEVKVEQAKLREKSEALLRELASAREQLSASQAAENAARAEAEQAKQALAGAAAEQKKQTEQNEKVARQLASAREQLSASQAAESAARAEAEQAKKALAGAAAEQRKQAEQNEAVARQNVAAREQQKAAETAAEARESTPESSGFFGRFPSPRNQLNAARTRAERASELKKQKDRNTKLVRELASPREQLQASRVAEKAAQAEAEQAKDAGKKPSRAIRASELKPEVRSHADRAKLRRGDDIGGGPGSASESTISAVAITEAAKSLNPDERARLVRRCAAVLANPTKHNRDAVVVCKAVAAR